MQEVLYRPTAEAMEKYKPAKGGRNTQEYIDELRLELLAFCLQPHDPKQRDDNPIFTIKSKVRYLVMLCREAERERVYRDYEQDPRKELWFYAHNPFCDPDPERLIAANIEDLIILATVVPTPDYFDDGEKFCDKRNAISECFESLEETASDQERAQIREDLQAFEVKDDAEEE